MKKLLLLAFTLTLSLSIFSQTQHLISSSNQQYFLDTLTLERDTIIKHSISADYTWAWHTAVDTLEGTADATVELVVALGVIGVTPPDSAFSRLADNMIGTLALYSTASADPISFYDPYATPYLWYGLRYTLNSVTKWDIRNYLNMWRKKK